MKISVASEGQYVSGHFGHCQGFAVYEVNEQSKILKKDFVENPGHKPGFLPVFLKDLGADVIIAGGMGARAQQLFNEKGIEVVVGAQGMADDVIEKYLKGDLKSTGSVCSEHEYEGHCND